MIPERNAVMRERNPVRIAVIVPVYNKETVVGRCIESILGQTCPDLELILVDDGSSDASGAVCDRAASSDSRVKVIHEQNAGLMAAWMRGVRESSAPYLAFVDADDWIEPQMLGQMRAALAEPDKEAKACLSHPVREIVCCNYVIDREWNGTSEPAACGAAPGVYEGDRLRREIKEVLLGNETRRIIASRCMKLFSRELIENNMHFCDPSIRMGEDLNITTPAILDADRITVMEGACFYHYIYYADSMVHAYDPGLYDNMVKLRAKILEILMAKGVPNALEMTEREYLFLMCIEMKNELRCTIGSDADVIGRIRDICRQEHTGELTKFYPERVKDPANRIIIWMMNNPNAIRPRIARWIFLRQAGRSRA